MREAVVALNRLLDEATKEGWKVEVEFETAYRWANTGAYCPSVAVVVSKPVRL
jgi:hypothetical protein